MVDSSIKLPEDILFEALASIDGATVYEVYQSGVDVDVGEQVGGEFVSSVIEPTFPSIVMNSVAVTPINDFNITLKSQTFLVTLRAKTYYELTQLSEVLYQRLQKTQGITSVLGFSDTIEGNQLVYARDYSVEVRKA